MDMHNIVNGFYENVEERRLHMKQELSADIQNENTAPVIAQNYMRHYVLIKNRYQTKMIWFLR